MQLTPEERDLLTSNCARIRDLKIQIQRLIQANTELLGVFNKTVNQLEETTATLHSARTVLKEIGAVGNALARQWIEEHQA